MLSTLIAVLVGIVLGLAVLVYVRNARRERRLAAEMAMVPSDADLDTEGSTRALAYDRAWWFTRFVADRYGVQALRRLYLKACGTGHPGVETAVSQALSASFGEVLVQWRNWLAG